MQQHHFGDDIPSSMLASKQNTYTQCTDLHLLFWCSDEKQWGPVKELLNSDVVHQRVLDVSDPAEQ